MTKEGEGHIAVGARYRRNDEKRGLSDGHPCITGYLLAVGFPLPGTRTALQRPPLKVKARLKPALGLAYPLMPCSGESLHTSENTQKGCL